MSSVILRNLVKSYDGNKNVIDNINLAMCRSYKDFGQGFYLTDKETNKKDL